MRPASKFVVAPSNSFLAMVILVFKLLYPSGKDNAQFRRHASRLRLRLNSDASSSGL